MVEVFAIVLLVGVAGFFKRKRFPQKGGHIRRLRRARLEKLGLRA